MAACPNAATHGNPFRYCACGWTEEPDPTTRHPSTQHLLSLFEYEHLPPHLQEVSKQIADTAAYVTGLLTDGPELTAGLRKLVEAKDCFVRQAVVDRRVT